MIICTSCKIEKDFSEFQVRSDTGQHRKQCFDCRSAQRKNRYIVNKDYENHNAMVRYFANHEQEKEKRKDYYRKNKDAHKIRMLKWKQENPEKYKEFAAKSSANQRKKPYYKYREMLRSLIRRLGSNDKNLLGYSVEEFKADFEQKFKYGMTWDNYGEWEIDHIKPVVQFYKEGVCDPKIVNALSNLQPLWKSENRKKSSKYVDNSN